MIRSVFATAFFFALATAGCADAASTPQALAKAAQAAFDRGDFDAARALADLDGAPAELQFFYFDNVRECAGESRCTVATTPVDAEFREQWAEQARREHADAPPIEGLLSVTMKAKDGSSSGTMQMPYAKLGADYRLVTLRLSPAEIARRRATSAEQAMHELLAAGIYDNASRARRTDWETAATKLPADGGPAGAALLHQTTAMAAAVDAHDPDAAMRSGGQLAALIYADKDFEGKPLPLDARKRKLQVQALRMLRDVKISGGYQLAENAVLMVEARDGIGWIERGAVLLSLEGDQWDVAGKQLVTFPPEK